MNKNEYAWSLPPWRIALFPQFFQFLGSMLWELMGSEGVEDHEGLKETLLKGELVEQVSPKETLLEGEIVQQLRKPCFERK